MNFFHIPTLIILGGCIFCISEKHFERADTIQIYWIAGLLINRLAFGTIRDLRTELTKKLEDAEEEKNTEKDFKYSMPYWRYRNHIFHFSIIWRSTR